MHSPRTIQSLGSSFASSASILIICLDIELIATMEGPFKKPHVVAVPFPAMGHSIPFLDLATLLATQGLTVSFVTTPANVSRLQPLLPRILSTDVRLVALPPPTVEGLAEGCESTDHIPTELHALIVTFAQKLAEPFNAWIQNPLVRCETGPPVCIISDLFMGWTVDSALKFGIRRVVFDTCGAFATSLMHSASVSIAANGGLQRDGDFVVLPHLPLPMKLHRNEIGSNFLHADLSNPAQLSIIQCLKGMNGGSREMLINTFEELEGPLYLQHLRENVMRGVDVQCIGPVLPSVPVSTRGKFADIREEELVEWLDRQCPHSVVYVSFGSQAFLSREQTHALASGLRSSDHPFIWVIRVPPRVEPRSHGDDEASVSLPQGFAEETKGRGVMIKGWAPQLLILSHPSIGAFMTHCGWNSTLESVSLGVPLITWPMFADQHFNSKQVVEHLRIGVQFCQHRDGIPSEESVRQSVRSVLREEKGKAMRRRAQKLKEAARLAVTSGGSSRSNLEGFVEEMRELNRRISTVESSDV